MSNLSRRSLVASAAALPALALPAVAATNPELLALGERLKPLIPRIAVARRKARATSDDRAYDEWNAADEEMRPIADAILKIPAVDPISQGIRAAAALALTDEPEDADHREDILWEIAARAGFERPPEWSLEWSNDTDDEA